MFNITLYSDDLKTKTIKGDISTLTNGTYFYYNNQSFSKWTTDLLSLKYGKRMFSLCYELTNFSSNLPNLIDGTAMFYGSGMLEVFSGNLDNLTCGANMFYQSNLSTFDTKLGSLENAYQMFQQTSLTEFSLPLPKLINGHYAFYNSQSLSSVVSDMPNLIYGLYMFRKCPINHFRGSMPKLVSGYLMFDGAKLDPDSVLVVLDNINDLASLKQKYTDGEIPYVEVDSVNATFSAPFGFTAENNYIMTYANPHPYSYEINSTTIGLITLGLGCSSANVGAFLEEIGYSSISEIEADFREKGWTVYWQYNGPATMSLRDPQPNIFAKLVEVPSIDDADFTSQDGSKFYIIDWYHRTSAENTDYTEFSNMEEAISSFNVLPK